MRPETRARRLLCRPHVGAVLLLAVPLAPTATAADEQQTAVPRYYTAGILEPDRVASAWLIARHVDPGAEVLLMPEGAEPPPGAVPFDLPGAKWSRSARRSTYETILAERSIEDPALVAIGALIRVGELSYWMLKPDSPAERFDRKMRALALEEDAEAVYAYLDRVYRRGGAVP